MQQVRLHPIIFKLPGQSIETFISALWRPLPEDQALFSEVDSVLTEIRRCYLELDKFWTEEIYRAVEAINMRRVNSTDLERWKSFHANRKKLIGSWKVQYGLLFPYYIF